MIKLITIAKTFQTKEINGFKKYIHLHYSPESKAHALTDWILVDNANILLDSLSLDELYQLSPQSLKKQSFKNIISELGNVAEEFIAWQHWQTNDALKNTSKLISLAERNLSTYFLQVQKKITSTSENYRISIFNEIYKTIALFYNYNYQISESKDNYAQLFDSLITTFKTGVSKVAQSLLVEIKNRERLMINESWQNEMAFFDLLYENDTDIIYIMDQLLLLNNEDDDSAYEELIRILKGEDAKNLSHFLRYSILIYCTVYLHGVFKTGKHTRVNELLDLYEYGLEHKILTPNESIDTRTYLNVISVFSKLSSAERTLEIINKYNKKVDYADFNVIKQIAISTLDFNNGNFGKVIKELRTIEPIGFQLKFKTRWLQLKSLIEDQGDYPDVTLGLLSNFKRYINSNKGAINKPTYDGLLATIQILSLVINKKSLLEINATLKQNSFIFEKKWVQSLIHRKFQ